MLDGGPESISAVEAAKADALSEMTGAPDATGNSTARETTSAATFEAAPDRKGDAMALQASATVFNVGDLVALRSDPETAMPVIGVVPGAAETRYHVFPGQSASHVLREPTPAACIRYRIGAVERRRVACLPDQPASALAVDHQPLFVAVRTRSVRALSVSPRAADDPSGSAAFADRGRSRCRQDDRGGTDRQGAAGANGDFLGARDLPKGVGDRAQMVPRDEAF